ncbi:hypothetical protein [Streptacidiphilus monticola]|uniref:Uncharacterized protein n=1 Tax=Streptacidiphilus monticola TaxID=2161674 RepID=A0ABW1FTR8_9ACTN
MDEFAASPSTRLRAAREALENASQGVDRGAMAAALDELGAALLAARNRGGAIPPARPTSDAPKPQGS